MIAIKATIKRVTAVFFFIFTVLTVINCNGFSGFVFVEKKHNESKSEKNLHYLAEGNDAVILVTVPFRTSVCFI